MRSIEKLKEKIMPILKECDVKLYHIEWHGSGKNQTLEVAITKQDGTIDLDTCALVSEKLSEVLDQIPDLDSAYTLDVCSPGAEREITDYEELKHLQDAYVYVRFKKAINKKNEVTGSLHVLEDGYEISYRDKAVTKKLQFKEEDIDHIRFAVKI